MDLNYTLEEQTFQQEIRSFMSEKLPKRLSDKVRGHRRLTAE